MSDLIGKGFSALVVDDDKAIGELLTTFLNDEGFDVTYVEKIKQAKNHFSLEHPDLVLLDIYLEDGNGIDLIQHIHRNQIDSEILIITAHATVESAVEAMRYNVADYLLKPFENLDELHERIRRILDHLRLKRQNKRLVEELRSKNVHLEALAIRDALTGLFNHAYFQERLTQELSRSERHGHQFSLIFFDIDNFKEINDNYGHQNGDMVLKSIADFMTNTTRQSDDHFRLRDNDLAARYGGDEFVLLLPETTKKGATILAERLRERVENASFGYKLPTITLSLGVAAYHMDGTDRQTLIQAADTALYAAKRSGRNRTVAYSKELGIFDPRGPWPGDVEINRYSALDDLISLHKYQFVYQPIVQAKSKETIGFEALCRPTSDAFATPLELIDTAERTGKVTMLGKLLREEAVKAMPHLGEDQHLFLNLHILEINEELLAEVQSELKHLANRIVFEITESRTIKDHLRFRNVINKLRNWGAKIALDDFGLGYLGLKSVEFLVPDYVKLNAASFRMSDSSKRWSRLLRYLMDIAQEEGIQIIAKGVENKEDLKRIKEFGVDLVQGYYLGEERKLISA